ncbi:MAG: MBL fold metallo-hydrolase [Flavobacteriaceae bacterium]
MKSLINLVITSVIFLLSNTINSQEFQIQLETEKGNLNIEPVYHGSLFINYNAINILVDPFQNLDKLNQYSELDYVLITDIHGDHYNLNALESLDLDSSKIIAPQAVFDKMPENLKKRTLVLNNGARVKLKGGIDALAIPMYNLPETSSSRHPKGRGNGYVLELGGKRVYISGDTEDIEEMRSLKDIDLAFICMNLPYTMDVNQAASAVLEFQPAKVVPYHYRGKEKMSDINQFKSLVVSQNSEIQVLLFDWY